MKQGIVKKNIDHNVMHQMKMTSYLTFGFRIAASILTGHPTKTL